MMNSTWLLVLAITFTGQASADEPSDRKAWLKVCETYAKEYEISPASGQGKKYRMLPKPVFQHSQATRGSIDIGAVWLWVAEDGRPGTIGTVFVYPIFGTPYHNMIHEFHALAGERLTVTWRKKKLKEADKTGLQYKPLPDAPQPADSATGRRRQLRQLSQRFQAHSLRRSGDRWELRLISKPLYQYELKNDAASLGGALFGFCQGTDIEAILAIEARQTDGGFRWHYACGPFSDLPQHVRLDDREVWKTPTWPVTPDTPHWANGFHQLTLPERDKKHEDR